MMVPQRGAGRPYKNQVVVDKVAAKAAKAR
jgi:hypothetical protein